MKDRYNFLAIDIGATSGRTILGTLENNKLILNEISRFSNKILEIHGKYYWNIYSIYEHLKEALAEVARQHVSLHSIGIDTWGVDFVYLSNDNTIIELPRSYRDPYTERAPELFFERVTKEDLYNMTGIQIMNFNSLFQLFQSKQQKAFSIEQADSLLFIPDFLSYLLTGNKVCEYTIASTSQLIDPKTKRVLPQLCQILNLDKMLPSIVMPGHQIGNLHPSIINECGIDAVPVVAVAGHDTASAVLAVPARNEKFAYISSGTWSLMGIEVEEPIITSESFKKNFTNEGGVENTIRFLKNIAGMWLLEECKREWQKEAQTYSHNDIIEMATSVTPFKFLIDPDNLRFTNPTSMIVEIKNYCSETGQGIPNADAEVIRCIFDSLALKYKYVFNDLQSMAPFTIEEVYVIGGGAKNDLLNQLTANALNIPIFAGPYEATAIGNILMQAKGIGLFNSVSELRRTVRDSTIIKEFTPVDIDIWERQFNNFKELIKI